MAELKETVFECVDVDNQATFCSGERKWINKILRLKEKFLDEVEIVCGPDDNDGIILAHVPKSWLKVSQLLLSCLLLTMPLLLFPKQESL